MDTLGKIGSGEMPIDMATMKDILSNLILLQDSSLETVPHDTIANSGIGDALYGKTCENVSLYTEGVVLILYSYLFLFNLIWFLFIYFLNI